MCQKNERNNVRKASELAEGGSLGINRCFSLVETNTNNNINNFPIVGNASSSYIYSGTNTNSSTELKRTTFIGKNLDGIKKEVSTFLSQSLLRKNGKYPKEMIAYVKFEEEKKREREELKKQIEDEQGIELEQSNYIQPNDMLNQIIQQQQQQSTAEDNTNSFSMNKVDNLCNRLFHKTYSIVTDAPNRANSLNSINNNNNVCHGSNPGSMVRSRDKNSSMFSSKIHTANQNSISPNGIVSSSQTISFGSPIINAQFHSTSSQDKDAGEDEIHYRYDSNIGILHGSANISEKKNIIIKSHEKKLFQSQCSLNKQYPAVNSTTGGGFGQGSNCSSSFKNFRQKKVTRTSNSLKESSDTSVDSQKKDITNLAAPDTDQFAFVNIDNSNYFQTRDKKITPSFAGCFDSSENEFILDNDTCGQMADEKYSEKDKNQLFSQKPSNCEQQIYSNDIQTHQNTLPEITDCEIEDSGGADIQGQQIRSFDNHTSSNFAIFNQSPCNKQPIIGGSTLQINSKNQEKFNSANNQLLIPHSTGAIQQKENAFYFDEDEDSYGSGELKPCVQLAKHQSWSNSHNNGNVSRDSQFQLHAIKLKNSENVQYKMKQQKLYEELDTYKQIQQEKKNKDEKDLSNSSRYKCQQKQQSQVQQYEDLTEITMDASEFQERGKQTERSHDLSNYQFSVILTPAAKGKNNNTKIFEFEQPTMSKPGNELKKKIEQVELLLIPLSNNNR